MHVLCQVRRNTDIKSIELTLGVEGQTLAEVEKIIRISQGTVFRTDIGKDDLLPGELGDPRGHHGGESSSGSNGRFQNNDAAGFQVFLGGSCNPTTWRADIAIPWLQKNVISFYNPQVDNFTEDLLEIENKAKEIAHVLFFVINDQTRAVMSMVEQMTHRPSTHPFIWLLKLMLTQLY